MGIIRNIVLVCERPEEDRLKLFQYKRNNTTGKY